jgi:hypothetical protein
MNICVREVGQTKSRLKLKGLLLQDESFLWDESKRVAKIVGKM